MARSILLSDDYRKPEALREAGHQIQAGTHSFDAAEIEPIVAEIQRDPVLLEEFQHPERFSRRPVWQVLPWVLVGGMFGWLAYLIWRFIIG